MTDTKSEEDEKDDPAGEITNDDGEFMLTLEKVDEYIENHTEENDTNE